MDATPKVLDREEAEARCVRVADTEADAWNLADELAGAGYTVQRLDPPAIIQAYGVGCVGIVEDPHRPPDRKRWVGDLRYWLPPHDPGS